MKTALFFINDRREHGVAISVNGGRLNVEGPHDVVTDELVETLRTYKRELLTLLNSNLDTLDELPQDEDVSREARYGRVTCLKCANLTQRGVCTALSADEQIYAPLQYQPLMLWRRCEHYAPSPATYSTDN